MVKNASLLIGGTYADATRIGSSSMTPSETKAARKSLGLTQSQMAAMLGYQGKNNKQMMYDIETGRRPLRGPQRRLMIAYMRGYRPDDWPE